MNTHLVLTHTLNNLTIPAGSSPRLLYLLIETGGEQAGAINLPVHLGLVVDKSDSMMVRMPPPTDVLDQWVERGWVRENVIDGIPTLQVDLRKVSTQELQKLPRTIDTVKQALQAVVEVLRPNDRFALILFAGQAVTLVPLSPASERQRILSTFDSIEQMALGDDTFMGRGMALGLDELVRGIGPNTASRMIVLTDGYTLDEADCRALAQRARSVGISISTMGLGGFNEELLIPVADDTGGHAHNIGSPEEIAAAFQQELNAAQSIAFRNLELKLRVSQGVELRAAHRVRPAISHLGAIPLADRSASLSLGDYETNAPPALLLELVAPPRFAPGAYRLVQLMLAYDDPSEDMARQTLRQDVVVNYFAAPFIEPPHPRVMNVVERVTAFKLQTRALEDARRGDIASATRKLQAAATRLLDMGETDLAQIVQEQAGQLEQQGRVSPETAKAARYQTRRLTQKPD